MHAELTLGLGLAVNHKRVAQLMREVGISSIGAEVAAAPGATSTPTPTTTWSTRAVDGVDRRLLRQFAGRVVLGHHATRASRLEEVGNPCRSCYRDLRMNRLLVQPATATFQHRNALPG
ncbi:hypothetical protein [Pseudonocardia halophobica]|uniref:hypothetical protein n=1 Tax=Pseudonocardia halophobica TaxID=29401 RepID=UPI0034DB541F